MKAITEKRAVQINALKDYGLSLQQRIENIRPTYQRAIAENKPFNVRWLLSEQIETLKKLITIIYQRIRLEKGEDIDLSVIGETGYQEALNYLQDMKTIEVPENYYTNGIVNKMDW